MDIEGMTPKKGPRPRGSATLTVHGEGRPLVWLRSLRNCRDPGNQLLRSQQPTTEIDNEHLDFPALFTLR